MSEFLSAHAQVGTQGRRRQSDVERLVVDIGVQRIACNDGTSHNWPRFDKPLLHERRLKTLFAKITEQDVLQAKNVTLEHLKFDISPFDFC